MIRRALGFLIVVVIVVGVVAFLLGRWSSDGRILPESTVGASGPVDTSKAREIGGNIGEATARAGHQAKEAIETGGITAKIKSKMALDDTVKALAINVDTNGSVVTLTGVVRSEAERQRALELAKETEGVTSVVDHLQVR